MDVKASATRNRLSWISLEPEFERVPGDRKRGMKRRRQRGRGKVLRGWLEQRRRRAKGHEEAELGLVVAEQGRDHVDAGPAHEAQAVEYLDGPAQVIAAALGVLAETVLGRGQLTPGDLDLVARGECLGSG